MHSAESLILQTLLASGTDFVTGNRLAELLGVSRVTVWSHMKNLRRDGFAFEAVRNRGYRLRSTPERLSLPYLQCLLAGVCEPDRLLFSPATASTNRDAEQGLADGRLAPFVVLARRQTQGRGRLGRSWHSSDEKNLYASFAFRPEAPPERMRDFTLWIGASICRCLEEETGLAPGLKWPNDIWHAGRKMGGILTEAKVNSDQILELVLGLGLNVNSEPSGWPAPLCREATSLREARGEPVDINRLAAVLTQHVLEAYDTFLRGRYRDPFLALWNRYDILRGREVTGHRGSERIAGTAAGIDEAGHLLLVTPAGATVRLNAGDVTLKGSRSTK